MGSPGRWTGHRGRQEVSRVKIRRVGLVRLGSMTFLHVHRVLVFALITA